jgi:hypothetical protein
MASQAVCSQCLLKYNRTVLFVILIEDDAHLLALEQLCKQRFARLDWLAPQILPVKLKQIANNCFTERGKHGALASAVAADPARLADLVKRKIDRWPSCSEPQKRATNEPNE